MPSGGALVLLLGPGLVTSAERSAAPMLAVLCGGLVIGPDSPPEVGLGAGPTQRRGTAALLGPGTLAEQLQQLGPPAAQLLSWGWPRRRRGGLAEAKRSPLPQPS